MTPLPLRPARRRSSARSSSPARPPSARARSSSSSTPRRARRPSVARASRGTARSTAGSPPRASAFGGAAPGPTTPRPRRSPRRRPRATRTSTRCARRRRGLRRRGETACRLALIEPERLLRGHPGVQRRIKRLARASGAGAQPTRRFFLFTRQNDPAREAMITMKDEMERKGLRVQSTRSTAGTAPMERDELDPAFAWLDALARVATESLLRRIDGSGRARRAPRPARDRHRAEERERRERRRRCAAPLGRPPQQSARLSPRPPGLAEEARVRRPIGDQHRRPGESDPHERVEAAGPRPGSGGRARRSPARTSAVDHEPRRRPRGSPPRDRIGPRAADERGDAEEERQPRHPAADPRPASRRARSPTARPASRPARCLVQPRGDAEDDDPHSAHPEDAAPGARARSSTSRSACRASRARRALRRGGHQGLRIAPRGSICRQRSSG